MAETHEQFMLWVPKADYARIQKIAKKEGWLNKTGRSSGAPNMQQALTSILSLGIEAYDGGVRPVSDDEVDTPLDDDLKQQLSVLQKQVTLLTQKVAQIDRG